MNFLLNSRDGGKTETNITDEQAHASLERMATDIKAMPMRTTQDVTALTQRCLEYLSNRIARFGSAFSSTYRQDQDVISTLNQCLAMLAGRSDRADTVVGALGVAVLELRTLANLLGWLDRLVTLPALDQATGPGWRDQSRRLLEALRVLDRELYRFQNQATFRP